MTITQTFLTLDEIELLSHVAPDVFDNPINSESARLFLFDQLHYIVVAQDMAKDGLIVGFVSASKQFHPDWAQPELFISEVGGPPYQKRGIGKALMQMMLDKAKEMNCKCAWVATDADNIAARALYKSVGGKPPEDQIHIDFDNL
jgi:ribosomal protein S18 acetylase RimI-like enzyme